MASSPTSRPGALGVDPVVIRETDMPVRLAFSLRSDGGIDLDAMRPATRARVIEALRRTTVDGSPVSADDPAWTPIADQLVKILGVSLVALVERMGYSHEQAMAFLYSPEERAAIAGPASRVLRKRMGPVEESEEALLVLAIVATTLPKLTSLRKPATLHEIRREPSSSAGSESS